MRFCVYWFDAFADFAAAYLLPPFSSFLGCPNQDWKAIVGSFPKNLGGAMAQAHGVAIAVGVS